MKAKTKAGEKFVEAAQNLIPNFRERASTADSNGQMCEENFEDLKKTRVAAGE
jgi:hypothetical protein